MLEILPDDWPAPSKAHSQIKIPVFLMVDCCLMRCLLDPCVLAWCRAAALTVCLFARLLLS